MFYKNYNLVTLLLLLFFCQTNAQINCVDGNFEQFNLPNSYSMETAVNADTQGCSTTTIQNLGAYTFPSGFPPLNANTPVSFVSQQNEPTLASFGELHSQVDGSTYALRLNSRSTNVIEENTTVLTRDLGIITDRYLKINYSAVFHVPDHPDKPNFVKFSVINKSTGFTIAEKCLDSNDTNGVDNSDSSDDLITVNGNDPLNTWRYNDWSCLSFDLNKYVGKKSNLELRIIAADCGESFHDTLLYLDNICLDENSCEDPICLDGDITMSSFNINCPSEPFTVSGNYTLPDCAEDPTSIELNLITASNPNSPIFSVQGNFSNNSYSFTINPSGLNLDTSLEYDLVAIANFSDGSNASIDNFGREITFIDCDNCDDYSAAILDEYIDGTQSGSNYVYLMANGNYPSGTTYTWTTIRQNGLTQTYPPTTSDIKLVSASINNRITSASVTLSYEDCTETVNKIFDCAIPNSDVNGNLFPECQGKGGGGFSKKGELIGPCKDGYAYLNPISINCPSRRFTVSGNYVIPTCKATSAAYIILSLQSNNPNTGDLGVPVVIAQSNFSNFTFSFSINTSTLNLDSSLEYDLSVAAIFSDNSSSGFIGHLGREITFVDCDVSEDDCNDYSAAILDEYIDGTQSGANYVYLMTNGNYPSGTTYTWTTIRQNGLTQTYPPTTSDIKLVSASISNRITSASVTLSYEDCTETVNKIFDCAIPNSDVNGDLFPECDRRGGGGFLKKSEVIKVSPNPVRSNENIKINGLDYKDIKKVEIIDFIGNIKSTHQLKSNTFSIGNLKTGIYFLRITTKKDTIQKKIVIN